MKQHIIGLLAHPRYLILNEIDVDECPHDGYYDDADSRCTSCELGEECRWLSDNEAFIALARKPVEDLIEALKLAADYTASRLKGHNARACICESCIWLRNTRRFLKKYSIDKRRGAVAKITERVGP